MALAETAFQPTIRKGVEVFVAALEAAGIEKVFGIPGEENTDLMFALEASDIEFVLTRHEQAAAFMASVHGRITGRPAACLSTLGPGATNLLTGVADAQLDKVPLVAITAQAATGDLHQRQSHQVVDLDALFAPVTKLSRTIMSVDAIPETMAEAVQTALRPTPGAVHICLPQDIASEATEGAVIELPPLQEPLPAPATVLAAAEALRAASAPLVVVGPNVVRVGAEETVVRFVEQCKLPVVTSFMAKGVLPADHELNLFSLGLPFADHVDHAVAAADLVVAIGFDPIEADVSALTGSADTPVVHLSETPAAVDSGWRIVVDVTGKLAASVKALSVAVDGTRWEIPRAMVEVRDAMRAERFWVSSKPGDYSVRPQDLCFVIEQDLRPEDQLLSGVGAHKLWIARQIEPKRVGQLIIPNGLAGMGLALPGAIAAAPLTEGRVLAVCGDGDFLMNVQEMETAARMNAPITVMVWEDGGYGLIEWEQRAETEDNTALKFGTPDWAALCKAFGWTHMPMGRFEDLPGLLGDSRAAKGPVLITARVDYGENDAFLEAEKVGDEG